MHMFSVRCAPLIAVFFIASTPIAHAQRAPEQTKASAAPLTAKQAYKLRSWLSQGHQQKAWELLGDRVWCEGPLIAEWDVQKNLSLAADLGVYARRAGKLKQAARCTLEASTRQGTLHKAAALYEASLLVDVMGVEGFALITQEASWSDDVDERAYCPEYPWAINAQLNISCAIKLAAKAPKAKQKQAASDYLLRSAASFAPRPAYLSAIPRSERARFIELQLKGYKSITAPSEAQMWQRARAKVYGSDVKTPSCASLRRKGVDPNAEGQIECKHFAKVLKKTDHPEVIALEAFEAGINEYGTTCEESSNVYVLPYRKTASVVHYVMLDDVGYTNGCGSGSEHTEVGLIRLTGEPKSILVAASGSSREGAGMYSESERRILCQQEDTAGGISCLSGSWRVDHDMNVEGQPRSSLRSPRFTLKGGRIKLLRRSSRDFRFTEYDALQGLTVAEAVAALPVIEASIQRRYIDLVKDEVSWRKRHSVR